MPRVSYFFGISIRMYADEGIHHRPHFHAKYGEYSASFGFDGQLIAGSLPAAQLRLVSQWAQLHQSELAANWAHIGRGEHVEKIDPLT